MKVIYVGRCNSFAANLVDRFVKQDYEVYIFSDTDFTPDEKPVHSYKWYQCKNNDAGLQTIFNSVKPNTVVFAGNIYMEETWEYETGSNIYFCHLMNVLNQCAIHAVQKFIFLSSSEVYGCDLHGKTEEEPTEPVTLKGLLCKQGEGLVQEYHRLYGIETVILRIGDIYGFAINEKQKDFLSNIRNHLYSNNKYQANRNKYFVPVHRKDCVDAILRAKDITPSGLYNVGGFQCFSEEEIVTLLRRNLGENFKITGFDGELRGCNINSCRIKKELEWVCFYEFFSTLSSENTEVIKAKVKKDKRKLSHSERKYLEYIENISVFLGFGIIMVLVRNHAVLRQLDLMYLYIIIISLFLGLRHSFMAVVLSALFYVFMNGISFFNLSSILVNAQFLLQMSQYLFIGATIGYSVDHYQSIAKEKSSEYEYLLKDYKELSEINEDNTMIKLEYEKRLISSRNSLPKLYSVIQKLTSLEPELIFQEAVHVVEDIMETDSVFVYLVNKKMTFLHLIAGSDNKDSYLSKSISLNQNLEMKEKVIKGEIYIGSQWKEGEPALVAPIMQEDKLIAVIVINRLKFTSLNLYNMNLFRTLILLIASSIIKAMKYEESTNAKKYIPDTEILIKEEFEKLIQKRRQERAKRAEKSNRAEKTERTVSAEKTERESGDADYCIIQIDLVNNLLETYYKAANLFRNTDYFGTNDKKELLVFLGNTSSEQVFIILNRLKENDLNAVLIEE
jgi:nucleoside-diphosphate-sugar epimerase